MKYNKYIKNKSFAEIILKRSVRKFFKLINLEIKRLPEESTSPLIFKKIDVLLDVGAHIGQYAQTTRSEGYKNKIISFEPLIDVYEVLKKNAENDPQWEVYKRCAIGSEIGKTEINISGNSYSSSILPMLSKHSDAAPESAYIGKSKTDVTTLDFIYEKYDLQKKNIFLKMDTQGYETKVLNGLKNNLKHISGVQLELSIVPLYDGQDLYEYFFDFFEKNGFYLWSVIPGFGNNTTGQMLQFDAVFMNKRK